MSSRRNTSSQYIYRTNANAALKPEIAYPRRVQRELEEQEQRQRRNASRSARQAREARALQRAYCAVVIMMAVVIGGMGFLIVSRHAQIYKNNQTIRRLSATLTSKQLEINTVEKDAAVKEDLTQYFAAAEAAGLSYPTNEQVITVQAAAEEEKEADTQKTPINVYDAILDWWNSLSRRN